MLTLDQRANVSAALEQWSDKVRAETVPIPAECPLHPGEREFDQDWIFRLIHPNLPLRVLASAILAGCPELFYHHLQWSVYVLEARGFIVSRLYDMLNRLSRESGVMFTGPEASLIAEVFARGRARIESVTGTLPPTDASDFLPRQIQFLQALMTGTRPGALRVMNEAIREGQGWIDICSELIQAGLYEVGRLWALHQISVGQEHMATAVAELAFSQLAFHRGVDPSFRPRGCAVVAGVGGEQHRLGSLILADTLESRGWEIRFLGVALPTAYIIDALKKHKALLLCLSLTLPSNLPAIYRMIQAIRSDPQIKGVRILLGGQALQQAPDLGAAIGANGSAISLKRGLDLIEQWGL